LLDSGAISCTLDPESPHSDWKITYSHPSICILLFDKHKYITMPSKNMPFAPKPPERCLCFSCGCLSKAEIVIRRKHVKMTRRKE
jgi:hypothetical protein